MLEFAIYRIPFLLKKIVEMCNTQLTLPLLESCDRIVATTLSYASTSPILSQFMDKIEVIPNAVDTKIFRPGKRDREPIVLFVGRLVEYKGVEALLRAMKEVKRDSGLELSSKAG
jgi:rhamnosyl/mannosyltransferase